MLPWKNQVQIVGGCCVAGGFETHWTKPLSVDRNSSLWITRSTGFLPDLAIRQEQTAVY